MCAVFWCCWLKRGDQAAQSQGDVVFAPNREALEQEKEKMQQRGISQYVVSAHVVGDLVKFYGVQGTGFFRYYYPTDDGQFKFSDEARNGEARHYAFSEARLQQCVLHKCPHDYSQRYHMSPGKIPDLRA